MSSSVPPPASFDASPPIISLDRQAVSTDGRVRCPLRAQVLPLERCLECGLFIRRDRSDPPRFIVCYARVMSGWLGLDEM